MDSLISSYNGLSPHFDHQFPTPILSGLYRGTHKVFSGYINTIVKAPVIEDNQGINLVNPFSYILRYVKLPQSN